MIWQLLYAFSFGLLGAPAGVCPASSRPCCPCISPTYYRISMHNSVQKPAFLPNLPHNLCIIGLFWPLRPLWPPIDCPAVYR